MLESSDGFTTFAQDTGNFYLGTIFDLGDIFTARFTSNIVAEGFSKTSLMMNWTTLAAIDPIAGDFTDDDYNAATYVRTKASGDVIADWTTMTNVGFMSFGSELSATPWARFTLSLIHI